MDRAPRYGVELPVRYRGVGATEWHDGTTKNLSESGVLFRTAGPQPPEKSLVIVFDVGEVSVGCRGEVVRTAKLDEQWAIAARFGDCYLTPSG